MEFPHLNDTKFPNLGNVDVYAYQNDFDYTRWVPNTKLKLVNVKWNGDYNDVVKFASDDERDKFFDELSTDPDCAVILNTNMRMDKSQIKVPIPFDKASQYNYLVVDIPIATSSDNPINYESSDGFHRWHFFIQDWQNTAPSTTVLTLALDVWTQYINSVGISYMMLERGHAPVAATDTDTYLSNPMDNSEYLLTPDVDFGGDTISRGGKFIPFGNGEKYICFASSCPVSQLSNLGTVSTGQSGFTNPTFSDASNYPDSTNRWGYQYTVNGYSWGTDKSYSGTKTPAGNNMTQDGRIPNNTTVYAVKGSDADGFLSDLLKTSPTFLKTILGCFMVDTALVTVKSTTSLAGHTVYVLQGNSKDMGSFKLTKDMFNYPEKYQRFAKLYTYPYSELEVTDNDGKSVSVRIESTGSIRAQAVTSVAFPYLNMRMFLTGIAGVGSQSYKWTDLNGSHDESISNSDWYKFCYDFEIPMYALYMDGQTAWNIQNYNRSISNGRNSALVNYHNSVRQANNAYANAVAESNTAETNAHNMADTNAANLKRTASTQETNTDNSANTLIANNANSCNANSTITAANNANNISNTAITGSLNYTAASYTNDNASNSNIISNNLTNVTTKEENETTAATTTNNNNSGMASAIASGAMTGGVAGSAIPGVGTAVGIVGGAAAGALMASAGAFINGNFASANSTVITNSNSAIAAASTSSSSLNVSLSNQNNISQANNQNQGNERMTQNTCDTNTANCNTQNTCATNNTANTASTMKTNADNSRATAHTNASNQNSTSNANATRTKNTAQSNAGYTRRAAVVAAQDILTNTQNTTKALVNDSANMDTVQLCSPVGDMTSEYMRNRGVQIKVRTQPKNAIRSAGDEFVRFGYALNQIWDVDETGLCLMKHFTYWKASDCWVYDKCETNDTAQNTISALFNRGITVWSNPLEVGKVNPYDN